MEASSVEDDSRPIQQYVTKIKKLSDGVKTFHGNVTLKDIVDMQRLEDGKNSYEKRNSKKCSITNDIFIHINWGSGLGLPFDCAFTYAANNPLLGYKPLRYNMLKTSLLQRENANIERLLIPTKGEWRKKGLSIVSDGDGWSDLQRRWLVNFMAISNDKPMFLKSVDRSDQIKD
ncbi:DUF659 domain-containing protein [Cucumis melo var. makuwa]|uniref:DUF659 domain-containing protein n=1 Tax=Cucumis melo var. makuwa TaxID=1194695 RepID=A0A5D3BQA8_CUCMM|nr:DUF659 domain-containing protein [Cucumis melo var. makuwa]